MASIDYVFEHPKNLTTFDQMFGYFNSLTDVGQGGLLGIIFLIVIGGVLFMMTRGFGNERAAGVTTMVVAIIAVFFKAMNLINNTTLTICVLLVIPGIWLLLKESANYEQ